MMLVTLHSCMSFIYVLWCEDSAVSHGTVSMAGRSGHNSGLSYVLNFIIIVT